MVRFAIITVVLLDGTTVAFKRVTLNEVATQCLEDYAHLHPMLIKIGEHPKLYFDKKHFVAWQNKEISLQDLQESTMVDNLARNKVAIDTDSITIEDYSLWLVKDTICILADDDTHITEVLDNRFKLVI